MNEGGDIVDFEAERLRLRRREEESDLPESVRNFGLRRKRPTTATCLHSKSEVDPAGRTLTCIDCGADTDPYDVLGQLASKIEWYERALVEHRELRERNEELRAEEKRTKARVERARRRAPVADGEVDVLRRIEAWARRHGERFGPTKLLAKLDALRAEAAE